MSNHLHVLLEVPPGCEKGEALGLSEEELLRRLGGLYSRNYTESVAREIAEAKRLMAGGDPEAGGEADAEAQAQENGDE